MQQLPNNDKKTINQDGDYYFCSLCQNWHILRSDKDSKDKEHLIYFDEEQTNSPSAKYYFCTYCKKWHKGSHTEHLAYKAYIGCGKTSDILPQPKRTEKMKQSKEGVISEFDGTDGLWTSLDEHLKSISTGVLRQRCSEILESGRSLDRYKVQYFSRRDGFSFFIRGLKVAQVHITPSGFNLTLIKNIHNSGRKSVRQKKCKYVFDKRNTDAVSDSDFRSHLIDQSQTLLELRRRNAIGYVEKWLHGLLIEQMCSDGAGLGLDFLFYETPVGKVKRNRQFGREHVDIAAKEHDSDAFTLVEIKKDSNDLGSAISQSISYMNWVHENRQSLTPRINELGWDADLDNLKLYVIAPGYRIPADELRMINGVGSGFFSIKVILINHDWYVDEEVRIVDTVVI